MKKLFLTMLLLTMWQYLWADNVSYYECSWNQVKKLVDKEQKTVDARKLSEVARTGNNMEIQNGWYYVDQDIHIDVLYIKGNDVHLILKDKTLLECNGGVRLDANYKLSVYSQQSGVDKGKIQTTNKLFPDNAAIGCAAGDTQGMGTLVVHGGSIWATAVSYGRAAGIGGGNDSFIGGSVTIYDGYINAQGGGGRGHHYGGAGIGGGDAGHQGGPIEIFGGEIHATGGGSWDVGGAGIGGGDKCNSGVIKIHGGKVEAVGSVNAGAAIGGGRKGNSGEITIDGGFVDAQALTKPHMDVNKAAAIGSGLNGIMRDKITISGGTVIARAVEGAGIGCGKSGTCQGEIEISGDAVVTASSVKGAGIGGGNGANSHIITIKAGFVTASSVDGAGIGGGNHGDNGTINIQGGFIGGFSTGKGSGIGGGNSGNGGTINISGGNVMASGGYVKIGWFTDQGWMYAAMNNFRIYTKSSLTEENFSSYAGRGFQYAALASTVLDVASNIIIQLAVTGTYYGAGIGGGDGGKGADMKITGGTVIAKGGNADVAGIGGGRKNTDYNGSMELDDNMIVFTGTSEESGQFQTSNKVNLIHSSQFCYITSNRLPLGAEGFVINSNLQQFNGRVFDAALHNRKFLMGGQWNTVCLPFTIDNFSQQEVLRDGKVYTLSNSTLADGKLTLWLQEVDKIEAGKPYLIRWTKPTDYDEKNFKDYYDQDSPTFYNVKIETVDPSTKTVSTSLVDFVGRFAPQKNTSGGDEYLMSNDDGKVISPGKADFTLSAYQAQFHLKDHKMSANDIISVILDIGTPGNPQPVEVTPRKGTTPYYECSWNSAEECVVRTLKYVDTKPLPAPVTSKNEIRLQEGWYYADKDVTQNYGCLEVQGTDVHLIIKNDVKLKIGRGVHLPSGHKLSIYSQTENGADFDHQGQLTINSNRKNQAAIGGHEGEAIGDLDIHGCIITASRTAGNSLLDGGYGAGIGNGACKSGKPLTGGTVTVYAGFVQAEGGDSGAGIGGGAGWTTSKNNGVSYYQYGGQVTATGGEYAAGIGGGGGYDPVAMNGSHSGGSVGNTYIYGGRLTAYGGLQGAGIGSGSTVYGQGGSQNTDAEVIIYGGEVLANGGKQGAGIGGGDGSDGVKLTIKGGDVDATGGKEGAGIGGGCKGSGRKVVVSDGVVSASGGIDAAGIGGGYKGKGGEVVIEGGTIEALVGDGCNATYSEGGSAIGSGKKESQKENGNGVSLVLMDNSQPMMVSAGSGRKSIERVFTAAERVAACKWRNYVKIEYCFHETDGAIGYNVIDKHDHQLTCKYCGERAREKHDFVNGKCVCGQEGSNEPETWQLTLYEPAITGDRTYDAGEQRKVNKGSTFTLPNPVPFDSYDFMGWLVDPYSQSNSIMEYNGRTHLKQPGDVIEVTKDMSIYARYGYRFTDVNWKWDDNLLHARLTVKANNGTTSTPDVTVKGPVSEVDAESGLTTKTYTATASVSLNGETHRFESQESNFLLTDLKLYSDKDNDDLLDDYDGMKAEKVELMGYQLINDGKWHTIVLPFDISNIYGTKLQGADIVTLQGSTYDEASNTLNLNFTSMLSSLQAGKPYLYRFSPTYDIIDPPFNNVTVKYGHVDVETDYVDFVGTYSPVMLVNGNTQTLYMGKDNKLYYPSSDNITLSAFHAAFVLYLDQQIDEAFEAPKLSLSLDGATGIGSIDGADFLLRNKADDAWYTLDGQRLQSAPTRKGLFIHQGRKVIKR